MPEFETVSLQEAQLRSMSGRQGRFMNQYVSYIQQLSQGQAGKLHPVGNENLPTIRRRLISAAQALGITLVIKRSGEDLYFWSESREGEQPRPRRPRRGRAGDLLPLQSFGVPVEGEQGESVESPELGRHNKWG